MYLSLVQANSNSSMMELYYSTLIKLLDKKQPGWRSSTIILTDNAPYHSSKAALKKRGRKTIPPKWSRILDLDEDSIDKIVLF